MIRILRRLARMSATEAHERSRQFVLARIERLGLDLESSENTSFAIDHRILPGHTFDSLSARPAAAREIARRLVTEDREAIDVLRRRTQSLHRGRIDILGLSEVDAGNPPRWHREVLTGLEAPTRHWSKIAYLDPAQVGDHKVLWEINRCQYLLAPAIVWLADGHEEDFQLIERHLLSWLHANPFRVGINWASSLEVSLRAMTWCWLLWLLSDAPWAPSTRTAVARSLEQHAAHIERYLSVYFSPNTHLTGEALGLFYIGTALPESRHARRWRERGARILDEWLVRQVHPDGVYFEQATQYQRYTAEIGLQYFLLARASGVVLDTRVRSRLNGLFDVLRSIAAGSGGMPLIGDDDGGLLLPLDGRPPEDLRALLLLAATALDRKDLLTQGAIACKSMSYWLCGMEKTDQTAKSADRQPEWRDRYFPNGGVAVLRDGWDLDDAVAVIDAGPHGALNCAHAHADALSMVLSLGGHPLFVDRGTLTYVGAERNEFRATRSHNTLEIDSQSSVEPATPFQWHSIPPRAVGALFDAGELSVFSGAAFGHRTSARQSMHFRSVVRLRRGTWLIHDLGTRAGASSGTVRWQLAPGLSASPGRGASALIEHPRAGILATVASPLAQAIEVRPRSVSPRYGAEIPATLLEIATGPELQALSLIARGDSVALRELREINCDAGRCWSWQDPVACWRVMVPTRWGASVEFQSWRSDAALLILISTVGSTQHRDAVDWVVALRCTRLEHRHAGSAAFDAKRVVPGSIVAARDNDVWRNVRDPMSLNEDNA